MPKAPQTVSLTLKSGQTLEAQVRPSARARRAAMLISPRGAIILTIPQAWPRERLETAAAAFLPWLEQSWPAYAKKLAPAQLPNVLELPLAGRSLGVTLAGNFAAGRARSAMAPSALILARQSRRLLLLEEGEAISLFGETDDVDLCAAALRTFCRRLAARVFPPRVRALALKHGFAPPKVCVRDQKSRWGSLSRRMRASGSGGQEEAEIKIQLNWRALLLPPPLFDHLCCHELCHMRHMNHSAAYRAELARLSPGWRAHEKELSRFWRHLAWWALPEESAREACPRAARG